MGRTLEESGLCCMAAHAAAQQAGIYPWTCVCPCHTRNQGINMGEIDTDKMKVALDLDFHQKQIDWLIEQVKAGIESDAHTVELIRMVDSHVGRLTQAIDGIQKNQDMLLALVKKIGGIETKVN